MTVPLLAGAALTTFAPHAAPFFGSFTNALYNGALPILAVFYVCMGARISITALPRLLKKGGVLLGTKIVLGLLASFTRTITLCPDRRAEPR
jgi:2-keto-3-deoxygluconate permease